MKAFSGSHPALTEQAGLILLFDGEVDPAERNHDEHNQTGILTSGLNLAPAFPVWQVRSQGIVAFGQKDAGPVSDERAVIIGRRRTAQGAIEQQLSHENASFASEH